MADAGRGSYQGSIALFACLMVTTVLASLAAGLAGTSSAMTDRDGIEL